MNEDIELAIKLYLEENGIYDDESYSKSLEEYNKTGEIDIHQTNIKMYINNQQPYIDAINNLIVLRNGVDYQIINVQETFTPQNIFSNLLNTIGNITDIANTFVPNNEEDEPQPQPLDKKLIKKLKSKKYKDIKKQDGDDKCSICFANYSSNDKVIKLPCQHFFHKKCILKWLKKYNDKCPICRQSCDNNFVKQ